MNAAGWMKRGSSVGGLQIVSLLSRSLFPSAVPVFEVDWGRMLKKYIYSEKHTGKEPSSMVVTSITM